MPSNQMNPAQLQAVMHGEGPMLVLAGPGSGKTTVIVNRILYLIKERRIPPEEILVVTFTKDAALSMQNRFVKEAGEHLAVNFGTFHSVFYHILREADYFGSTNSAQLFTQSRKKNILITILKEVSSRREKYVDMETLKEEVEHFLSAIGFYKNTEDEEAAVKFLSEEWRDDFKKIFEEFRKCMRKQGGLDFDDMVYECRELFLRDKECLKYWQERFSYILVDEMQDINPLQYEVLKLLSDKHRNLFVVGDDDQSIYGFRGSKPACVRRFLEDFRAKQVILNANYRSSQMIVKMSEKVIAENKERFAKECFAAGPMAECKESVVIKVFQEASEQLGWIKEELKEFIKSGDKEHKSQMDVAYKMHTSTAEHETCAVLFRTNTQMQRVASALTRANIPFSMRGQTGNPYDHFIAKDIMAYLRFARGERSRELFLRIMNRPVRYLDREAVGEMNPVDLMKLRMNYARRGRPTDSGAMQEIDALNQQLTALKRMSPGPAVTYLCKAVGYEKYLREKAKSGEQLEEWLELLDFLKQEAKEYCNLEEWVSAQKKTEQRLGKIGGRNGYGEKVASSEVRQEPHIHLMTVHASKGLEFDRVIIPDCNEKTFPHGNMPDKETVEEERRIFYVGMTRAKKRLELLCVTGSKERPKVLSRFLNPIKELIRKDNQR